MIRVKSMETAELLLAYVRAAQGYEQGILEGSSRDANRHHAIARRIFKELTRRGSERELIPLFSHPRPIVRLWAAVQALTFEPEPAVQVLEELVKSGSGVARLDAIVALQMWNEGTLSK